MVWMAGAAAVALDALATLQKTLTPPGAGSSGAFSVPAGDSAAATLAKSAAGNVLAPSTLQALMAEQSAPAADQVSPAIFSALDADGDGQLSQSEFTAACTGGAGHGLAQLLQKQVQMLATPGQSVALTA